MHFSIPERITNRRAADSNSIDDDARHLLHAVIQYRAHLLQVRKRSFTLARKPKIIANNNVPGTKSVHENAAHEVVGADIANLRLEARAIEQVDTMVGQGIEFLAKAHKSRGWAGRGKEFFRCGLETHHDGGQTPFL